MAGNVLNLSLADQTIISQSLNRLCNQSIVNIQVPRFDAYQDVHDFMAEFGRVTSALTDEQKLLVLPRAFPVNCQRAWYDTELVPLINQQAPWHEVKAKILSRFASAGLEDKHFARLRELKYEPEGQQSLLSHIEDIVYSYRRAYPGESDEITLRYIKLSLPTSVKAKLNWYPDFKNANSLEMLKSAVKEFDLARDTTPKDNSARETAKELTNLIKELMNDVKKENLSIRQEMTAALRGQEERQTQVFSQFNRPRQQSPVRYEDRYRQKSPQRVDSYSRGRSPSFNNNNTGFNRNRSPMRRDDQRYSDPQVNRQPVISTNYRRDSSLERQYRPPTPRTSENRPNPSVRSQVYDADAYVKKFGPPPGPCPSCKGMHWARHCLDHLN